MLDALPSAPPRVCALRRRWGDVALSPVSVPRRPRTPLKVPTRNLRLSPESSDPLPATVALVRPKPDLLLRLAGAMPRAPPSEPGFAEHSAGKRASPRWGARRLLLAGA